MVSSQGTAITEAIQLAETYYDDEDQVNRVLFIVSDGEDHEGNVAEMAEAAADKGIKIYVDKKSLLYLLGTTLDFSDGLNGKGFQFVNPNASRTCG